jgi:hypothetical protein
VGDLHEEPAGALLDWRVDHLGDGEHLLQVIADRGPHRNRGGDHAVAEERRDADHGGPVGLPPANCLDFSLNRIGPWPAAGVQVSGEGPPWVLPDCL